MIKVAVFGARGRMGAEVCRAVSEDPDTELVAEIELGDDISAISAAGAEVAVDFTVADSAVENIAWCIENNVDIVIGTTAIPAEEIARFESMLGESPRSAVFIAPNFAIGAVLMMRFSEIAAKWMDSAEIIELHHPAKLDAPSGTALKTAGGIAAARGLDDEVPIHSVRLPGLVAHQEVIFGGPGQTLTIRHDSIDRASFMPGVLLAVKKVGKRPGLTIGLDKLLDL